jgi:hypothetical protein
LLFENDIALIATIYKLALKTVKTLLLTIIWLFTTSLTFSQNRSEARTPERDNPAERFNFENIKTMDPLTGKVPYDELEKARGLMNNYFSVMAQIPGIEWKERGPNNIGGRTRALMFDPNDTAKKKVWAGGVAGGLWYNDDITSATASWQKVSDFWDNLAISCIAYDPSNTQIFYVGTGEGYSNIDAVQGGGIWKTSDGGVTWKRLASTLPNFAVTSGQAFAFQAVQKIVVNSTGRVFAATKAGVWISTDGGVSWTVAPSIPSGGANSAFVSDLEIGSDDVVYASYGFFTSTASAVYKTNNVANDGSSWTANLFAFDGGRTELGLAPSTSGAGQIVYAANQNTGNNRINFMKRSMDGGTTWVDITKPTGRGTTGDITNGQAWYDLILSVHPTNPDLVFMGGATHARTLNATAALVSWNVFSYGFPMHPDHHAFVFRPGLPNEVIAGNDGGVYYSSNWGDASITSNNSINFSVRNKDYNVTQYYSAAIKNIANDGYVLTSAQDNGTHKITTAPGVIGSAAFVEDCCDGMSSFIDQNDPTIQIHATQGNWFQLHNESLNTNVTVVDNNYGSFINPADYDSQNNILYTYEGFDSGGPTYMSRSVITASPLGGVYNYFTFPGQFSVSFIKAAYAVNTVFYGTRNGQVYSNIPTSGLPTSAPAPVLIMDMATLGTNGGFISCIEIGANDNELLVTCSNFNVKSVFYTNNGGVTWISKDEATYGLPNIPIRYALFNPLNRQEVLLATSLGVWTTNNITLGNPQWAPTNAKLAHVSCDQLRYRSADHTVVVATHGRGVFTTQLNQANPCQTVMTLVAPYDNKTSGTTTFDKTQTISASNQISGTANVTMKAANSITLLPTNPTDGSAGFKVDTGAVFYAYITGCDN